MNKVFQNAWGNPTSWLKRGLMRQQKGVCLDCNIPDYDFDTALQVHRINPTGEYSPENCLLVCQSCHRKRHGR